MSKSVLVTDTPPNCRECSFWCVDEHWGINCQADDEGRITTEHYENSTKPNWCPLIPLPEYKDLTQYHFTGKGNTQSMANLLLYSHDQGYNDCLDDIQKGATQ